MRTYELDWNLCGFNNNFVVASVPFSQSKSFQAFLKMEIDQREFIYRQAALWRLVLIVHSLAVHVLSTPERIMIHRFLDCTYQHMTSVDVECTLLWAGVPFKPVIWTRRRMQHCQLSDWQ